jgi:hypothetical protein
MKKMGFKLFAVACFAVVATRALAYKPDGWAWISYPWMHDIKYTEVIYLNEADTKWVINLNTDKWYTFKNSLLAQNYWSYWAQYPFVFCAGNNSWYWFGNGTQWCRNMATDQWSVLGVSTYRTGEIQFTLEWDQPVDLDLEVQVGSETIYWNHDVGTGDANNGRLDKDNQGTRDSAGRFVENIYWPQGTAPQPTVGSLYRTIQPRVKYYDGNVAVNYTLKYKAPTKAYLCPGGTANGYEHRGRFEANAEGLTQIPYCINNYAR